MNLGDEIFDDPIVLPGVERKTVGQSHWVMLITMPPVYSNRNFWKHKLLR